MKKILAFLFIIVSYSFSQLKESPRVYDLFDCIETAKKYNTDIIIAKARYEQAQADVTGAFGDYLPSLNFNMGYTRNLDAGSVTSVNVGGQTIPIAKVQPNSYRMDAVASWTIFDGFAREANYRLTKKNLSSYNYMIKQTQQQVIINIYRQYIDVIRKYQIIKIRKEILEQGRTELKKSQAMYEAGTASKSNVFAQEAELGSQEFELIKAENDHSIAKANLLTTMGLNPDLNVEFLESSLPSTISDEEVQNFRKDIGSFESALNKALSLRPDYFASKEITESSESSVTIATSGYYPRLTASGGWTWSNSEFDKFSELGRSFIGLSLSVPIFENFNTNQNIQSAKLKLKQAEIQQYQTEQNIRNSLRTAFLNLDAAEKQLDITSRALRSAEMNYQSNLERYNLGVIDVSVYIDANRQYITAQINRISAIYSYFQAQKEVLYAIGMIDK